MAVERVRRQTAKLQLDEKSKRIIELLQRDGRMPYSEIGKEVELSEAAVRQRVNKLIETSALQIVAVTNPLQLGFARQGMVGIRVTGEVTPVADSIANIDQVDYLVAVAGTYDILAEIVCADDEEFFETLNQIRRVTGVRETETMSYMHLWNQKYNWGTR